MRAHQYWIAEVFPKPEHIVHMFFSSNIAKTSDSLKLSPFYYPLNNYSNPFIYILFLYNLIHKVFKFQNLSVSENNLKSIFNNTKA